MILSSTTEVPQFGTMAFLVVLRCNNPLRNGLVADSTKKGPEVDKLSYQKHETSKMHRLDLSYKGST